LLLLLLLLALRLAGDAPFLTLALVLLLEEVCASVFDETAVAVTPLPRPAENPLLPSGPVLCCVICVQHYDSIAEDMCYKTVT
jgi:hypothetical protein